MFVLPSFTLLEDSFVRDITRRANAQSDACVSHICAIGVELDRTEALGDKRWRSGDRAGANYWICRYQIRFGELVFGGICRGSLILP